jgi:hypothetical protein
MRIHTIRARGIFDSRDPERYEGLGVRDTVAFLAQPPASLYELAQAWRDVIRRHAQPASDWRCPTAVSGQLS